MGRPVCGQNRLFFRLTINRWGQAHPSQYYIMGVRGPLGPSNLVGCFFSPAPESMFFF